MWNGFSGVLDRISQIIGYALVETRGPFRLTDVIDYDAQVAKVERYIFEFACCKDDGFSGSVRQP